MIDLRLRTEPNLWSIRGDGSQLTLALMNLCGNAKDAMPRGGVLNISTHNLVLERPEERAMPLEPGNYVEIVVQDTGGGMPPEVLAQAFDPFFTTKGPGKGTGLGLASAYGIVQSHGGWIDLQSSPGQGTTCTIVLPALPHTSSAEEPGASPSERARPCLLVVDDDAALRRTMKRQLHRARYQVLVAASGEEALDLLQLEGEAIHLVLLDLGMPGMGGARCLSQIRARHPGLPVIVLSGYPPQEAADAVKDLDATYVVAKPASRDVLVELIQRALGPES
jgi:two-component system cell cycle sensor histidine kinase/response regulator CckA